VSGSRAEPPGSEATQCPSSGDEHGATSIETRGEEMGGVLHWKMSAGLMTFLRAVQNQLRPPRLGMRGTIRVNVPHQDYNDNLRHISLKENSGHCMSGEKRGADFFHIFHKQALGEDVQKVTSYVAREKKGGALA